MLMILWPLLSGLRNCRAPHVLFIRRAALCPFFLCCCLALFLALPGGRDLWAPSTFCVCLVQVSNEYQTYSHRLCFKDRNERRGDFCLFISRNYDKQTHFISFMLSFMNLFTCYNLKENLIHAGICIKGSSQLFLFFFSPFSCLVFFIFFSLS